MNYNEALGPELGQLLGHLSGQPLIFFFYKNRSLFELCKKNNVIKNRRKADPDTIGLEIMKEWGVGIVDSSL